MEQVLKKAFRLGQRYGQQADSEFFSDHRKADGTYREFQLLIVGTLKTLDNKGLNEISKTQS